MFYSHEILTSRQYGVATIWLVATTSNTSSTRRVTRKAIQEVDVQRACGKILEPGAPIALRLQVADAKKIQDQMRLFFKAFPSNQLDSEAGKSRPEDNLIEDDGAFDPNMPIPPFDPNSLITTNQGNTQKTSSQMSPQSSQLPGSHSPGQGFAIQLDIDHSSSSGYHGSPFGLGDLLSAPKPDDESLIFPQDDGVFGTQGDWGIEIDGNGNIIESAEPQLPPLLPAQGGKEGQSNVAQLDEEHIRDDQGDIIMQEEPLPEAEPFPECQQHRPWQKDERHMRQQSARRKRKLHIDEETQLSRRVIRHWQSYYLENCGTHSTHTVSSTQAKRNAMLLTFGVGIGNIGQSISVPRLIHPLAVEFSGDALFTAITRIDVGKPRRRRTALEAIDDNEQEERRVRPRLMGNEEEQEQARAAQEDDFINLDDPFADGALPEVGREAEHPMSDHLSSTLLPWNRGSSAVPVSSARAPNLAQQGRDLSSPLGKRGGPQDIGRYSDDAPMGGFGSDGNFGGGFGSVDSSFEGMQVPEFGHEGDPTAAEIQTENDRALAQLDREGYNFVNFIQDAINQNGERRQDADFDMKRKWAAFDDLFMPQATPRSAAAQAFYHTLCLVTKGRMYVEQDGAGEAPFGAIWIGVTETVESF